jgi:hypothetical protein
VCSTALPAQAWLYLFVCRRATTRWPVFSTVMQLHIARVNRDTRALPLQTHVVRDHRHVSSQQGNA